MKLTPSEAKLIELIGNMPGASYCPGDDVQPGHELQRLIRRLERKGVIGVEPTQDGPRYFLRGGANG